VKPWENTFDEGGIIPNCSSAWLEVDGVHDHGTGQAALASMTVVAGDTVVPVEVCAQQRVDAGMSPVHFPARRSYTVE
jgi:hypothetical protein